MITVQIKGKESAVIKALEKLKKFIHEKQTSLTPVKPTGAVLAEVEFNFRSEVKELTDLTKVLNDIEMASVALKQLQIILGELEQAGRLQIRVLSKTLDDYLTIQDAEKAFDITPNTLLNNSIKRDRKFDTEIRRGLVLQKGRQWLIHREALIEKYGAPKVEL
ncbi:hypothetical protein RB620_24465 [Paenibacillus sp. LHD-117]|uniref:hypothetical protein n=1 Tax=Paenibacillus sp. LHD-117 TaxID=3071412 RepID=UPI0027DFE71C|nr:hypothetical protein [Paenibacillus sp. LHD-117]MDQ6422590.1 hypothetical protein [Paenibacillus sp. LHD-117]